MNKRKDEENKERLKALQERLNKEPTLTRCFFYKRGYTYKEMNDWVEKGFVKFGKPKRSYEGFVINNKKIK
jgi:hypothetical protein